MDRFIAIVVLVALMRIYGLFCVFSVCVPVFLAFSFSALRRDERLTQSLRIIHYM